MPWLINPAQLDKFRKNQKNVTVVDASWHLADEGRKAKEEFARAHIPGARFLDLDAFNDSDSALPNMLLRDNKRIEEKVAALGIASDHKIIFYDQSKLHTSCRALWMFKVFGHNPNQLYILDGGFKAWEKYSGKVESEIPKASTSKSYTVNFQTNLVRSLGQMKANLIHSKEQVVDVRHAIRYAGGPEPRPNMRLGHMPGSYSFPFMTMYEADGCFKPLDKIRKQLTGIGVDLQYPIVTMCGSGVTAAIMNFVLDLMNQNKNSLYDGSWSEWGADELYAGESSVEERPVVTSLD